MFGALHNFRVINKTESRARQSERERERKRKRVEKGKKGGHRDDTDGCYVIVTNEQKFHDLLLFISVLLLIRKVFLFRILFHFYIRFG